MRLNLLEPILILLILAFGVFCRTVENNPVVPTPTVPVFNLIDDQDV